MRGDIPKLPDAARMTEPNFHEIKTKAKTTWATGSYNDVASFLPPMSAKLVRAAKVKSGDKVLDVATGTGVTAITARRAGANVVGLDLTPELLARAKEEAALAGVEGIEWREGDAEALPFEDASFDVVTSSFGHMFAPRPDVTARELVRVLRPGGRLGLVTHLPGHAIAGVFAAIGKHVPPPAGVVSPIQWGDQKIVKERLGASIDGLHFEETHVDFPMLSPVHFWRLFSTTYGPTMRALAALGDDRTKKDAMRKDFIDAITPHWNDGVLKVGYLLTTGVRK